MNYLTVKEIAAQWEVSVTSVSRYCAEEKIPGAKKEKGKWLIPSDAQKPADARKKTVDEEQGFTFVDLFCGVLRKSPDLELLVKFELSYRACTEEI